MYGQDRNQLRQAFFDVWHKLQQRQPLEPLEDIIAGVINEHPEYHAVLAEPDLNLDRDFSPETGQGNPFLHMAMHIAIQEQLAGNRPAGIIDIHRSLCRQCGQRHQAEHLIMECLGEEMWQAQRDGQAPDQKRYMENLAKRLKSQG